MPLRSDQYLAVGEDRCGDRELVQSICYPIARPLFIYTSGEPKGIMKEYIDRNAQAIVYEHMGF